MAALRVAQAYSKHWGEPKIHAMEWGTWDRIFGNRWKPLCRNYVYAEWPLVTPKKQLTNKVTCKHCLKQLTKRGIK